MGISPSEVLAMSIADYQAALYHHEKAHSTSDDEEISDAEADDMIGALTSAGLH